MRTPSPALLPGLVALGLGLALALSPRPLRAETGYDLWLRYAPLGEQERSALRPMAAAILVEGRVGLVDHTAAGRHGERRAHVQNRGYRP